MSRGRDVQSALRRAMRNLPPGWKWLAGRNGEIFAAPPDGSAVYKWVEEWRGVSPDGPTYSDGTRDEDALRAAPPPEREDRP